MVFLSMSIKDHIEILQFIANCSSKSATLIELSPSLLKAIREIAYNLLYNDLPLTTREKSTLRRHKEVIRQLVSKKVPAKKVRSLLNPIILRALVKPALRIIYGPEVCTDSNENSGKDQRETC
jgi:hypothetical protein